MKWLLVLLIGALIYKDVSHLLIADRYVLRAITQGLALVIGSFWMVTHLSPVILRKYWPALVYLFTLLLSMIVSSSATVVLFQILSLSAIMLFAIAHAESSLSRGVQAPNMTLIYSTSIILSLVFVVSLVLVKVSPGTAYDLTYVGRSRFSGAFGEPASMGAAAGLALGMALFGIRGRWLKFIVIILAISCLGLTLSRTYWVATAASLLLTAWIYFPRFKKFLGVAAVFLVLAAATAFLFNITADTEEASEIARVDSMQTLSGRTVIWGRAYDTFLESPIIGHGFTMGSGVVFSGFGTDLIASSMRKTASVSGATLHSGYMQTLVDSGLLGFMAYVAVIIIPVLRLKKYDTGRNFGAEFFILVYLLVSNIAENTIYSGASVASGIFWVVAMFALSVTPAGPARGGGSSALAGTGRESGGNVFMTGNR